MADSLMKKIIYVDPPSYGRAEGYREYLQKTFHSSCAYCTMTEKEAAGATFNIEHFRPQKLFPALSAECTNLRYSCHRCNLYKSNRWISEAAGCSRYCKTCKTHVCTTNIPRFIDTRIEDPADCFFEKDDLIYAYVGSKAAEYTIESLRLNRKQLVRLRHIRSFMENWSKELEFLLTTSRARAKEIQKRKWEFEKICDGKVRATSKAGAYQKMACLMFDLLETYERQNELLLEAEIDRLAALREQLIGKEN